MAERTMSAGAVGASGRLEGAEEVSKTERAYRWIRKRITTHRFEPGHKLVLAQLATELDTSVVPVREAIRRLEADGLVTFERNVGARVTMVDGHEYAQAQDTMSILEAAATAKAMPVLSDDDFVTAEAINEDMGRLLDDFDPAEFSRLNQRFHYTLYRRCPNKHLRKLVMREWERISHLRESIFEFTPGRPKESVAEHSRLLALLRAQASEQEIERTLREHRAATLSSFQEARNDARNAVNAWEESK